MKHRSPLLRTFFSAFSRLSVVVIAAFVVSSPASADSAKIPPELRDVGIQERLGNSVPVDLLTFQDEDGQKVHLSKYLSRKKPVLLAMAYFGCPNLCTFVLNGLVTSLKELSWAPGKEFEVVVVSIDPTETPTLARAKKRAYLESYGRAESEAGWHFLTGSAADSTQLGKAVGFGFRYDEKEKQYAHGAGLMVLTPDGKVSRYLYGIEYPAKDLKLALLEASNGKIGTFMDRILMFCYRYNAGSHKYSFYAMNLIRAGSAGTVLVFGGYLLTFWRRQRDPEEEDGPKC